MPSDNARHIRRHRARHLYRDGHTHQQIAELLGVSTGTVNEWVSDLVPRTVQERRARPHRRMPGVRMDTREPVRLPHANIIPPPEDRDDQKAERLRARLAAAQRLEDAAKAEGVTVLAARLMSS